jgi:hypothetical protein
MSRGEVWYGVVLVAHQCAALTSICWKDGKGR